MDRNPARMPLHIALALFISVFPFADSVRAGDANPRVHVVIFTDTGTLTVMRGTETVATFHNIAIGSNGASVRRVQGDKKTPLGQFHVAWINPHSRFYHFFGLDYPNLEHARRAFQSGNLSTRDWNRIRRAITQGKTPPQDTPLGGRIGIHGLGAGSRHIHRRFNWTNGCIALTNDQIDQLTPWIEIGTPVDIR